MTCVKQNKIILFISDLKLHTLINKILHLNIMEWHPTLLFCVYREYDSSYVGLGVRLRRKYSILTQQVNTISCSEKLLDVIIKALHIILLYCMVSIVLGDSWARLTLTVWNCPGCDPVRGLKLMSVHELISNECSISCFWNTDLQSDLHERFSD